MISLNIYDTAMLSFSKSNDFSNSQLGLKTCNVIILKIKQKLMVQKDECFYNQMYFDDDYSNNLYCTCSIVLAL